MRLIHTSDWHLGQELHGFDRGPEHDAFLEWLLSLVRRVDADVLVVTGDIYDSGNPPVPAQRRLYRFLSGALALNDSLQVVVIGGNHDSPGRLELPRNLLTEGRVHTLRTSMPHLTTVGCVVISKRGLDRCWSRCQSQ